ncbi:hypothetical protein M426DRAFT_10571 [Hypoxylon sp. CI-4A]|nr:hypothetical protein M426DRAFT_10571 [Hypoxylon sp. CI-4A]
MDVILPFTSFTSPLSSSPGLPNSEASVTVGPADRDAPEPEITKLLMTNLASPTGRPVFEHWVEANPEYWKDRHRIIGYLNYHYADQNGTQVIKLADIPGTLSGDILRLRRNLPVLQCDNDILGDEIRPLVNYQIPHTNEHKEDDHENLGTIITTLPLVNVDPSKHFVKKGKYKSEIKNLLKCQGGSCPGSPKSSHIVQLLGRSSNGELVFEKFQPHGYLAFIQPFTTYKTWILQLITGVKCLHSLGIVHRDLRIENLLFSFGQSRLIICGLDGRWGVQRAPEVSREPILDAGWTEKSDIYDLGMVIESMIYGTVPITSLVEWPAPPPFNTIVEACRREDPKDRPSLDELYAMVEKLELGGDAGD